VHEISGLLEHGPEKELI